MISTHVLRGLRMAVVGALAAGVLVGCGSAEAVLARDHTTADDRQATDSTKAGGPSSGGASEAPPSDDPITVSGSVTGVITDVTVSCTTAGSYLQWWLKGSLNGSKVELAYTSNNYHGAGTYNATSITDNQGGQLTWYIDGTGRAVSNGNDTGKFIVGADERSGSVDAQIYGDDGYGVQVTGPWQCS
jgi:hypothetical protein